MLAAGHAQRLFGIERDDVPAPLLGTPCHERSLRPLKVSHVNVWRNSPPNNEVFRIAVNHMEMTVSPFDFDRLCDQDFSREHAPHCPPLHSIPCLPERDEIGTNPENKSKPIIRIKRLFLRAVTFLRPNAEQLRRINPVMSSIGSVTVVLPTLAAPSPANDNDWPSEAEAA